VTVSEQLEALALGRLFDFTFATKTERGPSMSTDPTPPAPASGAPHPPGSPAALAELAAADAAQALNAADKSASVPAQSDARTLNSIDAAGNVMRHAYRVLSEEEKNLMVEVKDAGFALWLKIHELEAAGSRELSIAKTKVEESVMWAIKHLTK
jgi:hypothetical protein